MARHVYNTQIMQSEAVSLAYRMWRREWRGKGKEFVSTGLPKVSPPMKLTRNEQTAGALIWQLNDCWPVVSWSIVDFFVSARSMSWRHIALRRPQRRAKPAYYTIARELKPITVGIIRNVRTCQSE